MVDKWQSLSPKEILEGTTQADRYDDALSKTNRSIVPLGRTQRHRHCRKGVSHIKFKILNIWVALVLAAFIFARVFGSKTFDGLLRVLGR